MGTGDEIWLPVLGHEGSYEVSSHGRVRSLDREVWFEETEIRRGHWHIYYGRILKQSAITDAHKYHYIFTDRRGGEPRRKRLVHQLVLEAFGGPRPEGMIARHLDDNPDNNHASNLAWGTYSDNLYDAIRNGTHSNNVAAWHRAKTHCPAGHPLSGENLFEYIDKEGNRERGCRICRREAGRRHEKMRGPRRKAERRAARATREDGH